MDTRKIISQSGNDDGIRASVPDLFAGSSSEEAPDSINDGFGVQDDIQVQSAISRTIVADIEESTDGDNQYDNGHGLENLPLIKLYKRRWLILFLFCLVTMSNGTLWIALSSMTNIVERYYRVESLFVDWLSMSFLMACAIFSLPASSFLSALGLKATILMGASLNAVGACLRFSGANRDGFKFVVVGTCFPAIGSAFLLLLPPKIAAVWFSENERATATSIGVFMNLLGVAVGFLQSTTMVQDSFDINVVKHDIYNLLLSQAAFCTILLLLVYLFVRDKPPLPPSMSEALRNRRSVQESDSVALTFKESMLHLGKNWDFQLTTQAYGLYFGLMSAVTTLLNQMVIGKYPLVSDEKIGIMGFVGNLCGIFGTFLSGLYLDKTKFYKCVAMMSFFCSMTSMAAFTIVLSHFQKPTLLFALFCSLSLLGIPYFSCGLEQIAEITYPVKEDISCTIPILFGNLYGFVLTYALGFVVNAGHIKLAGYIMVGLYGLGFFFVTAAKVPMNRTRADHTENLTHIQ